MAAVCGAPLEKRAVKNILKKRTQMRYDDLRSQAVVVWLRGFKKPHQKAA